MAFFLGYSNKKRNFALTIQIQSRDMKYTIIFSLLLLVCSISTFAQGGLKGREYYSSDIIAEKLDAAVKEIEQNRQQLRAEAIAKLEEKKGRKLTDAETESIDLQLDEELEKAKLQKASTTMSLTITFTRDNELSIKPQKKIDEEVLKQAGLNWIKRKSMVVTTVLPTKSNKITFFRKGNLIITKTETPDTLQMSEDSKFLYGKFNDIPFSLPRTK